MATSTKTRSAGARNRKVQPPRRPGVVGPILVGSILLLLVFSVSVAVPDPSTYNVLGAILIAPIIIIVTLPFLRRQAMREEDSRLMTILVAALLLKLVGSLARYYVAYGVYGGTADATAYDRQGVALMTLFRGGHFDLGGLSFAGTMFIDILTGIVYTIIGPTKLGGFFVFSWLGFIGLFLFYRAFTLAVPEGRSRSYARLLFFLPSLLFWPSSIGKESWMMFCLGIAAFGAARMLTGNTIKGAIFAAIGLWWAAFPRPHVAALTGVALSAAFLIRPMRTKDRRLSIATKILAVGAVGLLTLLFITKTGELLNGRDLDTGAGISGILGDVASQTTTGSAQFKSTPITSPAAIPNAIVTVLYRPTLIEAHNFQAMLAALEGTFLVLLSLARLGSIWSSIRSVRRNPYFLFAILQVGMFVFAFSSIGNFGILARERVQMLPLFLVIFCAPPIARRTRHALRAERSEVTPPMEPALQGA